MKKKVLKKVCCFLSIMLLFTLAVPKSYRLVYAANGENVIYYTSTCINGNNDIYANKDVLYAAKKAKNVVKKKGTFSNSANISYSGEVHIYHFKVPSAGYWNIYTLGKNDTIIKVYEDNSFLWSKKFNSIGYNDDPYRTEGDYIGSYYNASLKVNLTAGDDCYICIRLFSACTGSYELHVEPNEDKLNPEYNIRNNNIWNITDISEISDFTGCYTISNQYLTKNETLLLYFALQDIPFAYRDENNQICKFSFAEWDCLRYENPREWVAMAYSVVGYALGMTLAVIDPTKICTYLFLQSLSLTVSGLSFIDSFINLIELNDITSLSNVIKDEQGCNLMFIQDSKGSFSGTWSVDNGLIITRNKITYSYYSNSLHTVNTYTKYQYSYRSYDEKEMMVGSIYDKGKWSN